VDLDAAAPSQDAETQATARNFLVISARLPVGTLQVCNIVCSNEMQLSLFEGA